jgi:hypothetical protein
MFHKSEIYTMFTTGQPILQCMKQTCIVPLPAFCIRGIFTRSIEYEFVDLSGFLCDEVLNQRTQYMQGAYFCLSPVNAGKNISHGKAVRHCAPASLSSQGL